MAGEAAENGAPSATTQTTTTAAPSPETGTNPAAALSLDGTATPAPALGTEAGAATPAQAPAAAQAVTPVEYEVTGDPGLDFALTFVGKRGLGPEHPAMQAATNGDFAPLKAALAAMGKDAEGFEHVLGLAERAYQEQTTKHKERQAKDAEAIHNIVGGEENWKAVREWAKNATEDSPEERQMVSAALQAGGVQAKAMAMYLHSLYKRSPGATQSPAQVTAAAASGKPAADKPVTAMEFSQQSAQMRFRLGVDFEKSPEYKALAARRVAAARAGIA